MIRIAIDGPGGAGKSTVAKAVAKELGNSKVLNSVVLGLAAKYIGFSEEEWIKVLEATVPQKTIEINKKAFMAGYEN